MLPEKKLAMHPCNGAVGRIRRIFTRTKTRLRPLAEFQNLQGGKYRRFPLVHMVPLGPLVHGRFTGRHAPPENEAQSPSDDILALIVVERCLHAVMACTGSWLFGGSPGSSTEIALVEKSTVVARVWISHSAELPEGCVMLGLRLLRNPSFQSGGDHRLNPWRTDDIGDAFLTTSFNCIRYNPTTMSLCEEVAKQASHSQQRSASDDPAPSPNVRPILKVLGRSGTRLLIRTSDRPPRCAVNSTFCLGGLVFFPSVGHFGQ